MSTSETSKLRTANLLGALATAIADRLEARLKTHPNQNDSAAAALNLIAVFEGCSNAQLSQAMGLSHPAAVRLVDRLEAAGLVEAREGADRRSVALHLTPAGRVRAEAALQARCVELEDLVEALGEDERRGLDQAAEALLRRLTDTPLEAARLCRLCDHVKCPPESCPVHRKALELVAGET